MSLWLALWIGFFPVATPLLPPGEADPLSAPWWQTTGEAAEAVPPLFDLPWSLFQEQVPVRPRLELLEPLWLRPGDTVAWRYQALHLPDSLPEPITHLFSRRGSLEYTHLGGVFAREVGPAEILLGAGFREHRWLGYPLRRQGYGLEARGAGWWAAYRKLAAEGLEEDRSLDFKRLELRHARASLVLTGFHLGPGANFYRGRLATRTWQAEMDYYRRNGLGRVVYHIPPPMGFLRLSVGFAGTGSRWFPDLQVRFQGPGYRILAGYRVFSRVDSLGRFRLWPRAFLQVWGKSSWLRGWAEVARQRDLWLWRPEGARCTSQALTLTGRLEFHRNLGPVALKAFAALAGAAAGSDTLLRTGAGLETGLSVPLYEGRVVLRPWSRVSVAPQVSYVRWDAGVHANLFRVVQGEFRAENLLDQRPTGFATLRRYSLLLSVVFPD